MMKLLKSWLCKDNSGATLRESVSDEVIFGAYKTREKEIESLRKYDRGEKEITPSNLSKIVRGI